MQAFQQGGGKQLHISTVDFPVVCNSLVPNSEKTIEVVFFLKLLNFQICFAAKLKIFIVTF